MMIGDQKAHSFRTQMPRKDNGKESFKPPEVAFCYHVSSATSSPRRRGTQSEQCHNLPNGTEFRSKYSRNGLMYFALVEPSVNSPEAMRSSREFLSLLAVLGSKDPGADIACTGTVRVFDRPLLKFPCVKQGCLHDARRGVSTLREQVSPTAIRAPSVLLRDHIPK